MQEDQAFQSEQKEAYDVFDIGGKDAEIIAALRKRVEASDSFYKSDRRYQIDKTRKLNEELLFGDPYKAGYTYPALTEGSVKYTESQVFVGIETIVSFLTEQLHEVEAKPFNDSTAGHIIARDFEKYSKAHGIDHDLANILVDILWDVLGGQRVGVLKFTWDPTYRGIGEIIPKHVDPARIVFDHKSGRDGNPGFIAEKINDTVQNIIARFPKQKAAILKHCKIDEGDYSKYGAYVDYYEVWVTGQAPNGGLEEQLVCYMGDVMLEKSRNPHWNYDVADDEIGNYLPAPPKPYLNLNLLNRGRNKLDHTSLPELVASLQHALNRRKRSIAEQAERWAGLKVWSGSAVDLDDVEELSGQQDESIVVDSDDAGKAVTKIPPDYVPQWFFQDAADIRNAIHTILGTPPMLRGDKSQSDTLGEAIMERDQSEGRLSVRVRPLDAFMNRYAAMFYHFTMVYYTEEHWKSLAGEDGTYDYVMMKNDRIKDGLDVRVKAGSNLPVDDARLANIAVKIADRLSTIDLYKLLKLPKPEKMYENYVKDQVDPTLLIKDLKIEDGDRTADMDYEIAKAGKDAPPREDVKPGHIDRHREQLASDEYNSGTNADGTPMWTPETKARFEAHVQAEMESLARRAASLEAKVGAAEAQSVDQSGMGMTPDATGAMPPMPAPPNPGMGQPPANVAPTPNNAAPMTNML